MRLESGPAKTDALWQGGRALLFLGFALYFVYDGAIGYPRKNAARAREQLQLNPANGRVKYEDLTDKPDRADFEALVSLAAPSGPGVTTRAQVTPEQVYRYLGKPQIIDGNDNYFFSKFGFARVTIEGDRVWTKTWTWVPWFKTKAEVQQQFWWAILPLLPALYFLWRLYKSVTLRAVVDDEALTYGNRRIAFADMASLRDYNPKGWIDLYYKDGEEEKRLRIDNEKILRFDDIIEAICQAKGFTNEVKAYRERKAREEAEREIAPRDASST